MKKTFKSALMLAATVGTLSSPIVGLANGESGLGLTGDNTSEQSSGLTGDTGLTGTPGLESTTTDSGLLGTPSQDNAFDNSLSSTDSDTTPISNPSNETSEPAFELTEAPETTPSENTTTTELSENSDKEEPKLELEESDDSYLKGEDLPKTGFASSAALFGGMGVGGLGMIKSLFGIKKKED